MDETSTTNDQPIGVTSPPPATGTSGGTRGRSSVRTAGVIAVATLGLAGVILGSVALARPSGSVQGPAGSAQLAAAQHQAGASGAQITVTGNGQVMGTPDTATFSIGVSSKAGSATTALEQNNAKVQTLETALEAQGVAAKDVQTSWLNLSTNTDSHGNVTGFTADNQLSVVSHDLAKLGSVLDAAVHATGDGVTFDGISFSISNDSALLASARAQAMVAARTQADQLATGGGLTLGPIVRVTDQENAQSPVNFYGGVGRFAASASAAVPIQTGQQQISVQVTVVYELRN